jgi:hypothetical protein
LIFKIVREGVDVWNESVRNQRDPITRAISATADELRYFLRTYPPELHEKSGSPQLPEKQQDRSISG